MKWLCYQILKLSGWTFKIDLPDDLHSFVFLGAPHTSNYDILPAMAVSYQLKRNAKFVIKASWLTFPMNLILKPMGAVGLNREKQKAHTTDAMAHFFEEYSDFVLMIAPEGTRSPTENWKTGFYYIAQKANVPIVLGFADYEKKIAGIGSVIFPTDFEQDMARIMDFYQTINPCKPENFKLDPRFTSKLPKSGN